MFHSINFKLFIIVVHVKLIASIFTVVHVEVVERVFTIVHVEVAKIIFIVVHVEVAEGYSTVVPVEVVERIFISRDDGCQINIVFGLSGLLDYRVDLDDAER